MVPVVLNDDGTGRAVQTLMTMTPQHLENKTAPLQAIITVIQESFRVQEGME
jgi:hypothetical protein